MTKTVMTSNTLHKGDQTLLLVLMADAVVVQKLTKDLLLHLGQQFNNIKTISVFALWCQARARA
jgi:hypothetical protein